MSHKFLFTHNYFYIIKDKIKVSEENKFNKLIEDFTKFFINYFYDKFEDFINNSLEKIKNLFIKILLFFF